jgi:hypothetical protein
MYCKSCLAANPDDAVKCGQCGAPLTDGIPAAAAPSAPSPAGGDFELQPEHTKVPDSGPPPLISGPPGSDEKKKDEEKPAPLLPKDYKTNAILLMVAAVPLFPLGCCCWCSPLAAVSSLIFGLLALLEGGKIKPAYEAGDYATAEEASTKTYNYIKIGVIAIGGILVAGFIMHVVLTLVFNIGGWNNMTHKYYNQ